MAWPSRKRKNPEMIATVLRTAFLAYVRVVLCLQGMFLVFLGWALTAGQWTNPWFWALLALGLPEIVTAVLLWQGRRGAAIAAIVIEALWAAAAVGLGFEASVSGGLPSRLSPVFPAAALFLATVVGLLLPTVRVYSRPLSPRSPGPDPGPVSHPDPGPVPVSQPVEPPAPVRAWRYRTVLVPCLLTFIVSGLVFMAGVAFAISGNLMNEAINGYRAAPGTGTVHATMALQALASVLAVAQLIVAAMVPRSRRAVARTAWGLLAVELVVLLAATLHVAGAG
jgi:hypothetical protein